jgi:threonine dehydrogenase-like Zn-dependent dehydrogenase
MDELQMALDLIESGRVDASSWTTQFALSDGVEAFETMLRPADEIKAILRPDSSH